MSPHKSSVSGAVETGDDEAAVCIGKIFCRKIEAQVQKKKKLYPGGDLQQEIAKMRHLLRCTAQVQFHAVSFLFWSFVSC